MRRSTWIALALLTLTTAAAMWEGRVLAHLQLEQAQLLAARQEAARLAAENRRFAAARVSLADLDALRRANWDLPGIRNEIGQLRARSRERLHLLAENERLAAQLKAGVVPVRSITEVEGAVARNQWAEAGFATPEAAVQTFFWAVSTKNVPAIAGCMVPKQREVMLTRYQAATAEQRQEMADEFRMADAMKGFRVVNTKAVSEDEVIVNIQAAVNGELLPLRLRRSGGEWKIGRITGFE